MKKVYWLSALGLLTLTLGAMAFMVFGQTHYHPLVQVRFADQSSLTFLDNPWTTLEKCQASNAKVLATIRPNCPSCQIVQNRCDTQLAAPWYAVLRGTNNPYHVVQVNSLRMVIEAPHGDAAAACHAMAAQIQTQQHKPARCLEPAR